MLYIKNSRKLIFSALSLLSLVGYGFFVFAAPPGSGGYDPGETLDPECNPGDLVPEPCIVKSPLMTADNGLTATSSNVQLGGILLDDTTIETDGYQFLISNDITPSILDASGLIVGESDAFPGVTQAALFGGSDTANSSSAISVLSYGSDSVAQMFYTNNTTGNGSQVSIGSHGARMAFDDTVDTESFNIEANEYSAIMYYQDVGWTSDQTNGITVAYNRVEVRGSDPEFGYNMLWNVYDPLDFDNVRENAILYNSGDWHWHAYVNTRDDSGDVTPINFLYTDIGGNVLSAPISTFNNSFWSVSGNAGTTAGTNFIGTTDTQDFVIKVNGIEMGRFYEDTGTSTNSVALGGGTASSSNMFVYGNGAGNGATNAANSNFFGLSAGEGATGASYSNFFGEGAGSTATNAANSNFFGSGAGNGATQAQNSNFFGQNTGASAVTAANSIFMGVAAGNGDLVNNTNDPDDYSILIGNFSSTGDDGLGVGFSNSIALGAYATNTASNQFMIGSTTRPIDTTRINGSSSTQCTITTGTGIACTSDERVKTNITDLTTDTLDKLLNVKTVTYNWLQNPTSKTQIGFLAQDLEQYFPELVETDSVGMKSVYYAQMTPILVEAIREMNLNVTQIADMTRENTWRDALIAWLGNASNKITRIFTGELCLYDENGETECINASQLRELKQSHNIQSESPVVDTPTEDAQPPTDESPTTEPVIGEQSPTEESPVEEPAPAVEPPTVDTPPEAPTE